MVYHFEEHAEGVGKKPGKAEISFIFSKARNYLRVSIYIIELLLRARRAFIFIGKSKFSMRREICFFFFAFYVVHISS